MARDPNVEVPQFTGFMDDPDTWPSNLPSGVTKDPKVWYAHRRTYADGRTEWEFYKRGSGGSGNPDPIFATVSGVPIKSVKEAWDKETEKENTPPTVSAPPSQPNIVSRDPNTGSLQTTPNPNYTPPAASASTVQKPPGGSEGIEGTPDPSQPTGFDNERPRWVVRDANRKEIWTRPLEANEEKQWRENRERSRNPGGKTDAELRAEQSDQVGKPTGNTRTRSENGTTVKETEYQLPDGSTVWRSQTEVTQPDRVGKPTGNTRQRNENGQAIKEAEYVLPDGTTVWRSQIAPADEKDAFGAEPEGAPELDLTADNRRLVAGLKAYSDWLSQQVKLHKDTGGAQGIPAAEATKLMERRIALAEPLMRTNTETINAQASQRGQDITQRGQSIGEVQNRRSMAQTVAADVNRRGDERLKFLRPEHAADHIAARQEELQNALAYARQWGGMQDVPEVGAQGFPALAQMRQQALSGIQTASQGGPRIFAERAPGPPPPMTRDAAMANPAFRPAPAVEGSETPVASAGPMVPVAVNPVDTSPIVLPTQLPGNTMANKRMIPDSALSGVEGGPPIDPSALAGVLERGTQGARGDVEVYDGFPTPRMSPRFMQEARYGAGNYFDPDAAGAGLSLELGIDPEIMKQAISGLYG